MAKAELSKRDNWQTESGPGGLAGTAEKNLIQAFRKAFVGTEYVINEHPTDLKHIYENVVLSGETLAQIFCPDKKLWKTPNAADGVFLLTLQSKIREQEKCFLAKSKDRMDGLKGKIQVQVEEMPTKECVNCSLRA